MTGCNEMNKKQSTCSPKNIHTKNLLMNAAEALMSEKGIGNFTVKEVCEKSNVSVGTFYNYFKSKDDLISDEYQHFEKFVLEEVCPVLNNEKEYDNLLIFAMKYAEYCQSSTSIQTSQQVLKSRLASRDPFYSSREKTFIQTLDEIFIRGQQKGEFIDSMPYQQFSDMFLILLRGYFFQYCANNGKVALTETVERDMWLWAKCFCK